MQDNILIVDDDRQLTSFLERFLKKHGYRAATAGSSAQMQQALSRDAFDLIVLDLILPDEDGFEIMRAFRRTDTTPVILLTARNEVYDRIVGLELGADDYMTKPYEPRELLARIRSVLRRTHDSPEAAPAPAAPARHLRFGDFTIDTAEMHLTQGGDRRIALTSTEFSLLKALATCAGEVLTREQILETVYGNAVTIADRAIDAHVARLRRKLSPEGGETLIRTVHGVGYTLAASVNAG